MKDVLGQAIHDHYHKLSPATLYIHNYFGVPEQMPVDTYFRDHEDMPLLELEALKECNGSVLDIGAGAGSHAMYLQHNHYDVTALEISPRAAAVIAHRGVKKVVNQNIYAFAGGQFNTLLLLMNGIGLTSNIEGLHKFLQHAKSLLLPGGQIIFDSSDVAYLYKKNLRPTIRYHGEIDFRYEYKKEKTDWFTWLYIDRTQLETIALSNGWRFELLFEDDHDQYLGKLTVIK